MCVLVARSSSVVVVVSVLHVALLGCVSLRFRPEHLKLTLNCAKKYHCKDFCWPLQQPSTNTFDYWCHLETTGALWWPIQRFEAMWMIDVVTMWMMMTTMMRSNGRVAGEGRSVMVHQNIYCQQNANSVWWLIHRPVMQTILVTVVDYDLLNHADCHCDDYAVDDDDFLLHDLVVLQYLWAMLRNIVAAHCSSAFVHNIPCCPYCYR